jgi:hypothetical protein
VIEYDCDVIQIMIVDDNKYVTSIKNNHNLPLVVTSSVTTDE